MTKYSEIYRFTSCDPEKYKGDDMESEICFICGHEWGKHGCNNEECVLSEQVIMDFTNPK
uniref:Uncharacterized protein n=1 Tax=viral metagenome TaxID=1070528 RepID=A0A6H1ZRY1_9ZZZZ